MITIVHVPQPSHVCSKRSHGRIASSKLEFRGTVSHLETASCVLTLHQALHVLALFYHSRSKLLDVATEADGPDSMGANDGHRYSVPSLV